MMYRRSFLRFLGLVAGAPFVSGAAQADAQGQALVFGPAKPFSFDALKKQVAAMAAKPFMPVPRPSPEILQKIDYDAHGKLKYKSAYALEAQGASRFPITFFHLGMFFQRPVRMHKIESGQAREVIYNPALFDKPADSPAHQLKEGVGFAGFRVQEPRDGKLDWTKNDWLAFLGASYFRAIGDDYQYGLSARGVAVNVANPKPPYQEEFPDFTHFWFETSADLPDSVIIYALLDGPSVVGAFKFIATRREDVIVDVDCVLHARQDIERFGLAPLTSMYWFSEKAKSTMQDVRPEVHDSDGLALWTGAGERIWRPLNNPPRLMVSSFGDQHPRGFGLMQRDRVFGHYMDGVHYERRPGLWIEPKGSWGDGAVQLIELPTDDEIHDNIVAFWVPKGGAKAGSVHAYAYRMHWRRDLPQALSLGQCVATRLGNGGQPGQPRPQGVRKFVVEFLGEALTRVPFGQKVEVVLWSSRGSFSYVFAEAVPNDVPGHWRAQFDLKVDGQEPVEMRCFLKMGDTVLTETWLYQYHP